MRRATRTTADQRGDVDDLGQVWQYLGLQRDECPGDSLTMSAIAELTSGMTMEAWVYPTTVSSAWRDVIYKGRGQLFSGGDFDPIQVVRRQAAFSEAFTEKFMGLLR